MNTISDSNIYDHHLPLLAADDDSDGRFLRKTILLLTKLTEAQDEKMLIYLRHNRSCHLRRPILTALNRALKKFYEPCKKWFIKIKIAS